MAKEIENQYEGKNVWEKVALVRVAVANGGLKKGGSGYNYSYFELTDFLPKANEEFAKAGILPVFSIRTSPDGIETAFLDITDGKDTVTFQSPTADVVVAGKSSNPIQTLGAKNTYMKRYLYVNALEIAEQDAVEADAKTQAESKSKPKVVEKKTQSKQVTKPVQSAPIAKAPVSAANQVASPEKEAVAESMTIDEALSYHTKEVWNDEKFECFVNGRDGKGLSVDDAKKDITQLKYLANMEGRTGVAAKTILNAFKDKTLHMKKPEPSVAAQA